jgi:hypothetical protein
MSKNKCWHEPDSVMRFTSGSRSGDPSRLSSTSQSFLVEAFCGENGPTSRLIRCFASPWLDRTLLQYRPNAQPVHVIPIMVHRKHGSDTFDVKGVGEWLLPQSFMIDWNTLDECVDGHNQRRITELPPQSLWETLHISSHHAMSSSTNILYCFNHPFPHIDRIFNLRIACSNASLRALMMYPLISNARVQMGTRVQQSAANGRVARAGVFAHTVLEYSVIAVLRCSYVSTPKL